MPAHRPSPSLRCCMCPRLLVEEAVVRSEERRADQKADQAVLVVLSAVLVVLSVVLSAVLMVLSVVLTVLKPDQSVADQR